jgi:glycosyltransferase involved in cell wall biosynthesis
LIVAEHASARFGGEAFLPLHYFRVLRARGIEAWLLSHGRVEEEMRAEFASDQDRLHFIPDLPAHRVLWQLGAAFPPRVSSITFGYASHLLTQVLQRRLVRELVQRYQIDVVHEPIPVSPKQPSAMFDVGVPVVIGPMNGGMEFPPGFGHMEGAFSRASVNAAREMAAVLNRLIPGKRNAAALLVANERTRRALPPGLDHVPVFEVVENGVDLTRFNLMSAPTPTADATVRFAFVGRLVTWKAFDVLLEAFAAARAAAPSITLDVFGDGPERANLQALAERLGIAAHVRFHGFMPQPDVAAALRSMHALVLPSLYECGGAVVLEAMAMGLPVIATRWGGPADYLDPSCGVLIELSDRPTLSEDLTRALVDLAGHPERRRAMGDAGRAKVVEQYDWERKVDRVLSIYTGAIANHRPDRTRLRSR